MERLKTLFGSRPWPLLASLAVLSLALATALFSGASFGSKSANSASLGAGNAKLSSSAAGSAIVSATGMKPGESKLGTISIGNQGDLEGNLSLKATGLSGTTLAGVLTLRIDDVTGSTVKKYEGKLGSFSSVSLGTVAAGATRKYQFTLSWPSGSTEAALQGLMTSANLQWELDNGFTDTSQNSLAATAATDWTAPSAGASVIARTPEGSPAGYIRAGGGYYAYANVTDSGNPASGISAVTADLSSITSNEDEVTLTPGSYVVEGVSYNYRSAELKAKSSLGSGSKSYSLDLYDKAGNHQSQSFSVTAYASFKANDIETANGSGGTEGKPEKGDSISFEFNNIPEAKTIVSGWNGTGTKSVTVSIAANSSNDLLTFSGATIGSVELKGDFTESSSLTFSGSTMSLSGSTVTIVLGAVSGTAKLNTAKTKAIWTPTASIGDLAGNSCSTSGVTGSSQKQF